MNLSRATTEPLFVFVSFQEDFDQTIKIGTAAFTQLRELAKRDDAAEIFGKLITESGEPWGKRAKYLNSPSVVGKSQVVFSQMGVIRVCSALDSFRVDIHAEYCRKLSTDRLPLPEKLTAIETNSADDETALDPIESLCSHLGFDKSPLDPLIPALRYFRLVRNCIAHRNGYASQALARMAISKPVAECFSALAKGVKAKSLPELPAIRDGKLLSILPRHSVLYCYVAFKAASIINQHLVNFLGVKGMLYMAAHHSLFKEDPYITNTAHRADYPINAILSNRYRVRGTKNTIIPILKEMGIWKRCQQRFIKLYQPK